MRLRTASVAGVMAAFAFGLPASASAGLISSSAGTPLPGYGVSDAVAISGKLAAQGDYPADNSNPTVQVFQRGPDGWSLTATVTPPPGDTSAGLFGGSLALESAPCSTCTPLLAVGGYTEVDVYAEQNGSWSLQEEIPQPSDSLSNFADVPGELALSGNTLAVGDGSYAPDGHVWIYTLSNGTWTERADLQGSSAGECDFGRWVSLSGNELLIGAPGDNANYQQGCGDIGEADLYTGSGETWARQAVLTDPLNSTLDGASSGAGQGEVAGPLFVGSSVGIEGSTAVVGEPGGSCGQALVFSQQQDGTWRLTSRLSNPQGSLPAGNCSFGTSVGVDGSRILVGGGISAAWVFAPSSTGGWTPTQELQAPPGCSINNCSFGNDSVISGPSEIVSSSITNALTYR